MKKRAVLTKGLSLAFMGCLGYISCMGKVMGYNPFVPAIYAVSALFGESQLFVGLGILLGAYRHFSLAMGVKYVFIILIEGIGIHFYRWANRNCSSLAAGGIAALATAAMNFSGWMLNTVTANEMLLSLSEAVLVFGLCKAFHLICHLAIEGIQLLVEKESEQYLPAMAYYPVEGKGRMESFAQAMDGLSGAFISMNKRAVQNEEEEQFLLEKELAGRLCAGCDAATLCWERRQKTTMEGIHEMLQAVSRHMPREEITKKNYVKECQNYPHMVEEALVAFGRLELNRAWYKRLLENRQIIASQLDAMANLVENWGRTEKNIDEYSRFLLAKITYEVGEKGLLVEDLHLYWDERKKLIIRGYVGTKWKGGIPSKNYLKALRSATGKKLRLAKNTKAILTREPLAITVYEDTSYFVLAKAVGRKKSGASVSGDSYQLFGLDNGNYYACLSDGMGSGAQASQESELVVDLMQRFLEAGFQTEVALQMMNSTMVLEAEDRAFSTLDLAQINLYDGTLDLYKIGAAPSFLLREGKVTRIVAETMPVGIRQEKVYCKESIKLCKGDFLVLVTDGVIEYLHAVTPEVVFEELFMGIETENADTLASELLTKVLASTAGYAMDDMTIIALGFWEK